MLQVTPQTKIYVSLKSIDFRLGIDGLCGLIRGSFNIDPLDGALFAFTNRRRSGIKFIIYDGQGYWFCYKRLSRGKLRWWPKGEGVVASLDVRNLLLLIYNGDPTLIKFQSDWKSVRK
jgi:transposase